MRVQRCDDGVRFRVRLTPKGGRDAVEGWQTPSSQDDHLKARVRAVPEDGKANAALIALIAKLAGVAKSQVSIAAGHTSRLKTLHIEGDPAALIARLEGIEEAK